MPNVFDRIGQIIRANVNDMLDNAEDPEAMLNQIINDMGDALNQADSDIADQIAQQKMMEGDLANAQQNAQSWHAKAALAVANSRDDLARAALTSANDYDSQVLVYSGQLNAQKTAVAALKSKRDQLEQKYESAQRNKDMLIASAHRAQAQQSMAQAMNRTNTADYASEYERMERKVRLQQAEADAQDEVAAGKTSVEDQFDKMQADQEVDAQLAALKAQMGKAEPTVAAQ